MSNILLAKPNLPDGFIDVSVGEPHIVREHLIKVFDLGLYELPKVNHMYEYPDPNGYRPLVQLLEEKHKHPVIVTNGAKQALGACFYALQQMGKKTIGMRKPYWALIPPLVKMHGLEPIFSFEGTDSNLLILPNNPDGFSDIHHNAAPLDSGVPCIHDAAYYTHIYLPWGHPLPALGDVQIFSMSKMLGLSGLRVGYVVCKNMEFYNLILQYMEAMTVGVSIVSQMFLFDLMDRMRSYPTLTERFENMSSSSLLKSKELVRKIDPEVLEVPDNVELSQGMFGWFKVGPRANFEKARINFIDGALFGGPGMIRMNLALPETQIQEIVDRLNASKE